MAYMGVGDFTRMASVANCYSVSILFKYLINKDIILFDDGLE